MSRVFCPNCGSEVILPNHSSVTCGVTLAKDTDNKDYYLNMKTTEYGTVNTTEKENKNMGKVTERLNTLKAAGIDTSNFFSVLSPSGNEVAMKWVDGIPTLCDESELEFDSIEQEIFANGYVKNTKLHRRWIMSQMFRALNSYGGFNEWLKCHGYDYQWKMTMEECKVLSQIEGKDDEAFNERSRFFTKDVIVSMLEDYIDNLDKYICSLRTYSYQGKPYYKIPRYGNVLVSDVYTKIYVPAKSLIWDLKKHVTNYKQTYNILKGFYNIRVKLPTETSMNKKFIDAYKGAGAFYTLKNMILFHGVRVPQYNGNNSYVGDEAMTYVYNRSRIDEGYKLLALLKATIEYNDFDFDKRMKELNVK